MWGDFTAIKWILEYLKHQINVWNVYNGRILSTFGFEFNTKIIHKAFDPKGKHFEPIETIPGLKAINIPTVRRRPRVARSFIFLEEYSICH